MVSYSVHFGVRFSLIARMHGNTLIHRLPNVKTIVQCVRVRVPCAIRETGANFIRCDDKASVMITAKHVQTRAGCNLLAQLLPRPHWRECTSNSCESLTQTISLDGMCRHSTSDCTNINCLLPNSYRTCSLQHVHPRGQGAFAAPHANSQIYSVRERS